jgi:hypothetical protein
MEERNRPESVAEAALDDSVFKTAFRQPHLSARTGAPYQAGRAVRGR